MSHLFCGRCCHPRIFGVNSLSVCKNCDVSISEMVKFLSSNRLHMQQAMFPEVNHSDVLHSLLSFDEISCKVLLGIPLKQSEFLKVDQTCLGDIISEDAGSPLQGEGEGQGGEKLQKTLEGEKRAIKDSKVSITYYCPTCASPVLVKHEL